MIDPLRLTAGGRLGVRPAQPADAGFAESLYVDMGDPPRRTAALVDWLRARFGTVYKLHEAWILHDGDEPVGWLQIHEDRGAVTLHQMHLVAAYRNRGLGSELVRELQRQAGRQDKPIRLHVMKINPAARALYERLGFVVTGEDARRYRMRWRPDAAARPADGA